MVYASTWDGCEKESIFYTNYETVPCVGYRKLVSSHLPASPSNYKPKKTWEANCNGSFMPDTTYVANKEQTAKIILKYKQLS